MPSTSISSNDPELIANLRRDEGVKGRPYVDTAGHLTIGVGHNLDASPLCNEAIDAQLAHDLQEKVLRPLDQHCSWWREAPPGVQRVIANLCFNLGINGLLGWPVTLGHLRRGLYKLAALDIRSNKRYVKQVGKRAERLAVELENA